MARLFAQAQLAPASGAGPPTAVAGLCASCGARRQRPGRRARCQRQDAADVGSLEEAAAHLRPADAVPDSSVASTSGSEDRSMAFLPDFVPYTHKSGCVALSNTSLRQQPGRCSSLVPGCRLAASLAASPLQAAAADSRAVRRPRSWPKKADLYLVRTDGMSCSRETVKGAPEAFALRTASAPACALDFESGARVVCAACAVRDHALHARPEGGCAAAAASGCLSFAYPTTQQQLLVWRERPRWCATQRRCKVDGCLAPRGGL